MEEKLMNNKDLLIEMINNNTNSDDIKTCELMRVLQKSLLNGRLIPLLDVMEKIGEQAFYSGKSNISYKSDNNLYMETAERFVDYNHYLNYINHFNIQKDEDKFIKKI